MRPDVLPLKQPWPAPRGAASGNAAGDLRAEAAVEVQGDTRGKAAADLQGDLRGGLTSATLTLVSTVSYAAVAAAPLGASSSAAAIVSGLIGAAVGGTVASRLGPAPTQIFSLRASVAVVIASAITMIAGQVTPGPAASATVIAWVTGCLLLAGVFQWLFGALRMGGLIRLVPHPVMAGFTVGIAIEMILSQWPHLLVGSAVSGLGAATPVIVAAVSMAAIAWMQWRGRGGWAMPAGLLAGVASHELMSGGLGMGALPGLQAIDFDVAPLYGLPGLVDLPRVGAAWGLLPNIVGFALVIAFVNAIETLTSAVAIEELTQRRFDADQALRASALGSLAAVCAGGLPVGGGVAASVANLQAGARTRRSGLVAVVLLVVMVLVCSRWLDRVPMAVVAALIFTVAFTLARAPLAEMAAPWRSPRAPIRRHSGELAVAVLVCALLLSTGILAAVMGGVTAATLLIVLQMRRTVVRREYDANDADVAALAGVAVTAAQGRRIRVFEVRQPLFFATAEPLTQQIERIDAATRVAIIDLTHGGAVDATAMRVLARCCATLESRGQCVLMVVGADTDEHAFDMQALPCRVFCELSDALLFSLDTFVEPHSLDRRPHMVDPIRARPSDIGKQSESPAAIDPALIDQAGRELARYVGPVGKVLALRAAARCDSASELYRLLALELSSADDRAAFLLHRPEPEAERPPTPPQARGDALALVTPQPAAPSPGMALTPDILEQATRDLSSYLGPLSKLLVSRAHAKAVDREHLYRLLARHLANATQRETFLLAAGVQLRPFDPLQR
jgi:sulfate permease, SulP family